MTDTVVPDTRELEMIAAPVARPPTGPSRGGDIGRMIVLGGLVAGAALIAVAYGVAGQSADGSAQFVWFWAGMLVFLVPAGVRLWGDGIGVSERYAIIVAVGLFTYAPKFLRNPDGPLFFDELAHWSRTERLLENGDVFARGELVRMSEWFPGLHAISAGIHEFTGIATWRSAIFLIAILHVAALLGIFAIALRVTGSYRVAGLAGFLYALNPGFMFFNSQFAYQSVAIVLAIWSIAAALEGLSRKGVAQRAWLGTSLILAVGCTITHHLSTLFLLVSLFVVAIGATLRHTREVRDGVASPFPVRGAWLLFGAVVVVGAFWAVVVAGEVFTYLYQLSPLGVVGDRGRGGGGRSPFRESGLPIIEQVLAFLAAPLAVGLAFFGWRGSRMRSPGPGGLLVLALSLAYVVSLPFVLVNGGLEGAHRSWPFAYVGISVLAAIGLARLPAWLPRLAVRRRLVVGLVAGALVVLTVGNLAGDVNGFYRFPGPWRSGTDTRNLTAELRGVTDWFVASEGRNQGVIADLPTNAAFGSLGWARMAWREPLWDIYFPETVKNPALLRRLADQGYGYLVIDRRMSEFVPRIGFYFTPDEPEAFGRTQPVAPEALDKFEQVDWATKIYASDHFSVYRVDLERAAEEAEQ